MPDNSNHHDRAETNRRNSLHSTGPKTAEGKNRSSLNAVRHGLTGQVVVLPSEDMSAYRAFCLRYTAEYQPHGLTEEQFVQTLADTAWRLNRCSALENGVFAVGFGDHRRDVHNPDPEIHAALVAAVTFCERSRELNTLSIYQQRLNSVYHKTLDALRQLQKERKAEAKSSLADVKLASQPIAAGFVCSSAEPAPTGLPAHRAAPASATAPVSNPAPHEARISIAER